MWLNEGFATFFQYYAVEALYYKSFVWQWWYLFTREEVAMFKDKDIPLNRIHSWKKWQPRVRDPLLKKKIMVAERSYSKKGTFSKSCYSFGFCPNYLPKPPPSSPQFGQLEQFFSDVKIQDLKISSELKILYILYNILYICNLKNSSKFNPLAFLKK